MHHDIHTSQPSSVMPIPPPDNPDDPAAIIARLHDELRAARDDAARAHASADSRTAELHACRAEMRRSLAAIAGLEAQCNELRRGLEMMTYECRRRANAAAGSPSTEGGAS